MSFLSYLPYGTFELGGGGGGGTEGEREARSTITRSVPCTTITPEAGPAEAGLENRLAFQMRIS